MHEDTLRHARARRALQQRPGLDVADELISARCEAPVAGTRVVKRPTTCKVPRLHLGQQRLIADCC
jgi:hypothetical protein